MKMVGKTYNSEYAASKKETAGVELQQAAAAGATPPPTGPKNPNNSNFNRKIVNTNISFLDINRFINQFMTFLGYSKYTEFLGALNRIKDGIDAQVYETLKSALTKLIESGKIGPNRDSKNVKLEDVLSNLKLNDSGNFNKFNLGNENKKDKIFNNISVNNVLKHVFPHTNYGSIVLDKYDVPFYVNGEKLELTVVPITKMDGEAGYMDQHGNSYFGDYKILIDQLIKSSYNNKENKENKEK